MKVIFFQAGLHSTTNQTSKTQKISILIFYIYLAHILCGNKINFPIPRLKSLFKLDLERINLLSTSE